MLFVCITSLFTDEGSKDNISAVIVQLPGAVLGPRDNVVEKKRASKPKDTEDESNGDVSKDNEEG